MKKKKILMTGTTGFIGKKLLIFLINKGYKVTDIIRKDESYLKQIRKRYKKNYQTIIIKNNDSFKKIKQINPDFFFNLATLYKKKYNQEDLINLNNSNIIFPLKILNQLKTEKITMINFGTMMEYIKDNRNPTNVYTASKVFFEEISNIFNFKNKYTIKFYETLDVKDTRDKIIPTILKAHKRGDSIKILNNLKLNFITIDNIFEVILNILQYKLKPGSYCLRNYQFTEIINLIIKLNKNIKKKVKFKIIKYQNNNILTGKIDYKINFKNNVYKILLNEMA